MNRAIQKAAVKNSIDSNDLLRYLIHDNEQQSEISHHDLTQE
ncbi:MAG: hypothetical protein ACWA44_14975 [Thiotrichales bacterium]